MKIHFKSFGKKRSEWENSSFVNGIASLLALDNSHNYESIDDPDEADIILLIESNKFKERTYIDEVYSDSLIRERSNDCFSLNYEPDALGILSGVYAGVPNARFEVDRHIAWGYVKPINSVDKARKLWVKDNSYIEPIYDMSFRGALSHPIRERLIRKKAVFEKFGPIAHIDRWFNHTELERINYWKEILQSRFVLCPRGISPVSIRLFEVLELGRVPIIISDEWVEPSNIDWASFSIRVRESDIDDIPRIIEENKPRWDHMSRKASSAWNKYFCHEKTLIHALNRILELKNKRSELYLEYDNLRSYRGWKRRRQLGWTIDQRIVNKIRKVLA